MFNGNMEVCAHRRLAALGVLGLCISSVAFGSPVLPKSQAIVQCFGSTTTVDRNGFADVSCSDTEVSGTGYINMVFAAADTKNAGLPQALAQVTHYREDRSPVVVGGNGAYAGLEYQVVFGWSSPNNLPRPQEIPVIFESMFSLELKVDDVPPGIPGRLGHTFASMEISTGIGPGKKTRALQKVGGDVRGDFDIFSLETFNPLLVSFGIEYTIELIAECRVPVDVSIEAAPHECFAYVDPFIRIDQAAFDAIYGPNSFPLAENVSIQLSQGITNIPRAAVPEPGTAWLVLASAAAAIWVRRVHGFLR